VAGAALREDYLEFMRGAGFSNVEIVGESTYTVGLDSLSADSPERQAFDVVRSVKVKALKAA
jgi:hypothetical protein